MNNSYWQNKYMDGQGAHSDEYDGWLDGHREELKPGDRVLDLGCGAGANMDALLSFGVKISGADYSSNAVAQLEERYAGKLESAECFDMRNAFPYPDNSFDAVIADLSLHYFSWEDTLRIAAQIRRVLRPGGMLIARVHSMRNLNGEESEQIEPGYYMAYGFPRRYFTMEDITSLFENWNLLSIMETTANRYGRTKHVIEFTVER